ncbi:MAG: hypothetical protein KBT27_00995 [Prevotellaceae bacterium]|nr:hypothetical protein [Candidatus Faecinaster equi]
MEEKALVFNEMDDFQLFCRKRLMAKYDDLIDEYVADPLEDITINNFFVVWSCKTLQNYKCLCSTTFDGDGVYVEYTYNGDKHELYEDVYVKCSNTCITER